MINLGNLLTHWLSVGRNSHQPWRFRLATLLALLALIWPVQQFLSLVLRSPMRTGVLVIASSYSAPWDINPWCEENIAQLGKLDKHNLSLRRVANPGLLTVGQWAQLSDDVTHLVDQSRSDQPLLVYINLHGAVSRDGQPCLLVQQSQPLDPESWLPLDLLVSRIRQALPKPRPVIIAIEGGRQHDLPLPHSGQNGFVDATRAWYAALHSSGQAHNLAVLLSDTAPYASVSNSTIGCDLFTACLAEALSGQCDQVNRGGNGNQRIEWYELERYLHDQVQQRSRDQRVVPQLTETLTTLASRSFIAWNTVLPVEALAAPAAGPPDTEHLGQLTACWKRVAELQSRQPWHQLPDRWGLLKRTLVAWEQAIFAGTSSRTRAAEFQREAQLHIAHLEATLASGQPSGGLEGELSLRAVALWQALQRSPALLDIRPKLQLEATLQQISKPCAVPMLVQMLAQPELRLWSQPNRLGRWADLQARIEQSRLVQQQLPPLRQLLELESNIDHLRRQAEDTILADSPDKAWDATLAGLDNAVQHWKGEAERVQAAIQFNEQMLARLPLVHQVIDMLALPEDQRTQLTSQLQALRDSVDGNRNQLAQAMTQDTPVGKLDTIDAEARHLFTQLAAIWQRLLFDAQDDQALHVVSLECLLNSGWLPVEIGSVEKAVQLRLATRKRLMHSAAEVDRADRNDWQFQFSSQNQNALRRWLNWTNELAIDARSIDQLERSWRSMHEARARASLGFDQQLAQPIQAWSALQASMRSLHAGQRCLNDFWKLPLIDGQDYYAALARAVTQAVSQSDRAKLEPLTLARQRAAESGLEVLAQCRPVWNEQSPTHTVCRVIQRIGIPEGIAALQIKQLDQAVSAATTLEVGGPFTDDKPAQDLPAKSQFGSQTLELHLSAKTRESAAPLVASIQFRGHRFESRFDLHPPIGYATVGLTAGSGPSRITVQASARQPRARILILDCSSSMQQLQATEGVQSISSNQTIPTRLDAARMALHSILDHWRDRPDHVGVMLYGHRIAAGTPEQGKLKQTRYLNRYPLATELEAFEDVETILPPGQFGDQEFSEVIERLRHVVPWGQTPLYLAVLQAVEELARYANQADRAGRMDLDVIVVSDGRNYQFNPTPQQNISLDQVTSRALQLGVRVHVIGFGIDSSQLPQATAEFTHLANQTHGSVSMEVQTAMQLVERVDQLSQPDAFRVRLPDGQWVDNSCNRPIELSELVDRNTPVIVEYQRTSTLIPVNPGAAVQLVPSLSNRLVVVQPAFQPDRRATLATPESRSTPFEVVVNAPRFNAGNGNARNANADTGNADTANADTGNAGTGSSSRSSNVQWQVRLERRDGAVAQRPDHLWLELQPQSNSSSPSHTTYIVCDPMWQSETTNPVLNFETSDWPDGADTATLKFWCSDQLPAPVLEIRCSAQDLAEHWLESLASPESDGTSVRYQLQSEADGITLVLLHHQSMDVLELLPMIQQLPPHTRIERRYAPAQCISVHRFLHPELKSRQQFTTTIYSTSAFKAQALRTTSSLELRLHKSMASVPVTRY